MSERRHVNVPAIICLVIAILMPALYAAGYFLLSIRHPGPDADSFCRIFEQQWQAEIYKPAASVESAVTGDEISTYWQPPPTP
jgi:hypothetical protein